MAPLGSGVAEIVNSCIQAFMETKAYYYVCSKHLGLYGSCYRNAFFPADDPAAVVEKPWAAPTNERGLPHEWLRRCPLPVRVADGGPKTERSVTGLPPRDVPPRPDIGVDCTRDEIRGVWPGVVIGPRGVDSSVSVRRPRSSRVAGATIESSR